MCTQAARVDKDAAAEEQKKLEKKAAAEREKVEEARIAAKVAKEAERETKVRISPNHMFFLFSDEIDPGRKRFMRSIAVAPNFAAEKCASRLLPAGHGGSARVGAGGGDGRAHGPGG
jgi:hypothetical protein